MKITVMVAMVAIVAGTAMCAQAEQKVTVYLQGVSTVPNPALCQAQQAAAKMFAEIGVGIDWRTSQPPTGPQLPSQQAITIRLATDTPPKLLPNALAFARPYEGVHLTVFWDRIQKTHPASAGVVLAHVLVHEITHILQGIDRHSDSGVMKACWTGEDYNNMTWKPLPFASEDVQLIQHGLAKRNGEETHAVLKSAPSVEAAD
jgi:hypothetical protein